MTKLMIDKTIMSKPTTTKLIMQFLIFIKLLMARPTKNLK
jgi:hypothetical protein